MNNDGFEIKDELELQIGRAPDLEVATERDEEGGPITSMRVTARDPDFIEELTRFVDNLRSRLEESPHEGTPLDDAP